MLGKYNARRVWVVQSPGGDITNVISQSALVTLLHANISSFQSTFLGQSVADLHVGTFGKIATVTLKNTYWDAFQLMNSKVIMPKCNSVHHSHCHCSTSVPWAW